MILPLFYHMILMVSDYELWEICIILLTVVQNQSEEKEKVHLSLPSKSSLTCYLEFTPHEVSNLFSCNM